MRFYIQTINRWLFGCLFFIYGCANQIDNSKIQETEKYNRSTFANDSLGKYIQSGDIITRTGNDFTSESLRSLNQHDKTYSHCGIANIENDTVFVYHAIGGDFNPNQKLKREMFQSFTNPLENRGCGIFRYNLNQYETEKLIDDIKNKFSEGLVFDMDFDLKTDNKMYCAEFVGKCLENATNFSVKIPHSFIKDFEYMGVDAIFLQPRCKKIAAIVYK